MKYIVQKFGGTSLNTAELREQVAAKIIHAVKEGYHPVVVVSAMGRGGESYSTDSLLSLAYEVSREIPGRESDLLMSCGEVISGVVLAATIRGKGFPAVFLTGSQAGIITDDNFNDARIRRVDPQIILEHSRLGKIVVVAGFQGVTEKGEITTLGRGGSDTTAAALGVALEAVCVDIYTDVEGIMTADPGIVNNARLLETITYNEICQLAHEGVKVIHPRSVEIAMQKNIPLRVRSTSSDAPGTLVTNDSQVYKGAIDITRDRIVTGITQKTGITQLKINMPETNASAWQVRIFKGLALAGISVDFINASPEAVVFTVKDEMAQKAVEILENLGMQPVKRPGCVKVAAIGAGMTGVPGVMAGIVDALTRENVAVLQSADSYTTIWVLVQQEDMVKAISALHQQFLD
ncbi:aspartate kinase [Desulfofarcimen acetoxidans DSM 771]|uniref:Aspartokinase n=1 Tax=Desulfofarcimen acetoxidans (strain ATCC 49208 / DSM 771 / KCTC 5769 / VKM B-1644 / 5575) TaxID=485916 RepID=C8W4M1_DESAS|nr:aspartate kinase [Desulfofarcimen acetoxidans]ACV63907.1 aspartate kinase [Desulfofarcimen acetoxidans DSM 771]